MSARDDYPLNMNDPLNRRVLDEINRLRVTVIFLSHLVAETDEADVSRRAEQAVKADSGLVSFSDEHLRTLAAGWQLPAFSFGQQIRSMAVELIGWRELSTRKGGDKS